MKRLATLLLAAGLVFGATQAAQAVEFKGSGIYQAYFIWSNASFADDRGGADVFQPTQRVRLKLEMIASENLRGVFQIESNIAWGDETPIFNGSGGDIGGDGINIMTKSAYLDWVIPSTDVNIRMGLQPFALPGMVAGSAVFDDDATGITVSKMFNQNVSASLFWVRAQDDDGVVFAADGQDILPWTASSAYDLFGLTVPLMFDGFNITPWGMYGIGGADSNIGSGNDIVGQDGDASAYWVGLTAELVAFDPFRVALDFNYGGIDGEDNAPRNTDGYLVSAIAEYTFSMATPGLLVWYGSGRDRNDTEGGTMPELSSAWAGTSMGFADYFGEGIGATEVFGASPVGTWGAALQAKDISFMTDLSHLLRVAYYSGTGNVASPNVDGGNVFGLTDDDTAIEVNFNTNYMIYENLEFVLELSYLSVDWDVAARRSDAYRMGASFGYSF